jgi:hypothetical protein
MSEFSITLTQTSQVGTYSPGGTTCKAGTCNSSTPVAKCSGCDWHYADITCATGCPSQPLCSALDPGTCPAYGTSFVSAAWAKTASGVCASPSVVCTYDASKMTYADITAFMAAYCTNPTCSTQPAWNTTIMPTFCYETSTTCTGGLTACPEMLDSTASGSLCRSWASANPSFANQAAIDFCRGALPVDTTSEFVCDCVDKAQDPVYDYINRYLSPAYNPGCWFKSCTNPQKELITSDVVTSGCDKSSMCAAVNNIIATIPTDLTKSQLQAAIACPITTDPIPLTPLQPASSSFFFWFIIIFIIFIFIILLIAFAFAR